MENQLTVIPPLADVGSSQATPRHCALIKMMYLLARCLENTRDGNFTTARFGPLSSEYTVFSMHRKNVSKIGGAIVTRNLPSDEHTMGP